MRITSAGTVLVGKTAEGTATDGIELNRQDVIVATRNGDSPLILNRRTSDGDIAVFRKDNTVVGSIGVYNSANYIQSGSAGSYTGLYFNTNKIEPVGDASGDIRADATVDLGSTANRFKDFYLSGTAYIAGTTGRGLVLSNATESYTNNVAVLNAQHSQGILQFKTASTERMRITKDGNVGIGTSAPTNSYGQQLHIHSAGASGGSLHLTDSHSGATGTDGFELISYSHLAYVWQRENSDLIFGTNQTERARITSTGNVGIGTASPSRKLTVYDASAPYLALQNSSTGTAAGDGFQIQMAGLHGYVFNYESGDLYLGAGGATRITAKSDGNVGIGEPSPTEKLDVAGRIKSDDGLLSNHWQLYNTGTSGFLIGTNIAANGYGHIHGEIKLQQFNANTQQIINFSATVSSIAQTVHTKAATADIDVTIKMFVYSGVWYFWVPSPSTYTDISAYIHLGNGYQGGSRSSNAITALSNAGVPSSGVTNSVDIVAQKRILANTSGKVGIGTTAPAEKLEVSGGHIKITNTGNTNLYINANNAGSDATIYFEEEDSVKAMIQHDASNDSMLFTDGALTNTMTLKSGNVGIGTSSPAYKLDVDGAIRTGAGLVAGKVYPYQKSITRALNDPTRWYKIYSIAQASSRIVGLKIQATGDNSNFIGEFTVNLAGYSFKHSIKLENYTYYNGTQLLDIATKIASDNVTLEIYVQVDPLTAYAGSLIVSCTDDNVITPTIVSEPSGVNTRLHSRHFPATTARNTSAMTSSLNLANGAGLNFFRSDDTRSGSLFHNNSGTVLRTNSNGDNLYLQANGTGNVYLQPTQNGYATVINEDGNDVDFRVESNNDTHALFVDAANDRVIVGASASTAGTDFVSFDARPGDTGQLIQCGRDDTSTKNHVIFANPNGVIGSIQTAGSATSYNTSSDQRLKENIADADDAGSKIDAVQVRKFDWKVDGSHQDYGMIAQELIEVAPEAVSAPADPDEMMGVDYSKLVPMLIKEIQQLRQRVAQLEP